MGRKFGLTQESIMSNFKEFDIEKGGKKTGVYENNAENRKKGRVGQKYSKDKDKTLEHTKTINDLKSQRSKLINSSKLYKEIQSKIDKMESQVVRDKDGNSIGLKKESEEIGEMKDGKREGRWIQKENGKTVGVATFKDGKIQTGSYPKLNKEGYYKKKEKSKTDWKKFYEMAKDTSGGESLAQFEKEFGNLTDVPHVKDALDNTPDFNKFMNHINKFETINDKFASFTEYINSFYGEKGIYPNKKFKNISPKEVATSIKNVLESRPDHIFEGDSVDREFVREDLLERGILEL